MSGKKYNNLNDCVVDTQKGVDGAFDSLYSMSSPYAYSAASHLLKNREDIEDALQNSFYYVAKHISDLRDPTAYLKWLNRIVINECKKILIDQNKHKRIFFAEKNRIQIKEISDEEDNSQFEKTDLAETVGNILNEMKPEKSEILKLYYFENLSYSEISEKLGIPIGTVMSRLHSAKKELEKKIKALQKDGTVLWSLPVLPLVAALLSYNVKAEIPAALIGQTAGGAATVSAAAASAAGSAGAAGAGTTAAVGGSVAVKAAAVAVAASLAVGGGIAADTVVKKHRAALETTAAYTEEADEKSEDFFDTTGEATAVKSFLPVTRRSGLSRAEETVSTDLTSGTDETPAVSAGERDNTEREDYPETSAAAKTTVLRKAERTRKSSSGTTRQNPESSAAQPSTEGAAVPTGAGGEKPGETTAVRPSSVKTSIAPEAKTSKSAEKQTKKQAEESTSTTAPKPSSTASTTAKPETTADAIADLSVSGGVLTGYSGEGGVVNIPASINGQNITAIGAGAFEGSDVTYVSIPTGVTRVGQTSFSDCAGLKRVSLPSGLVSIGDCAFDGCTSLESVTIPESVTNIGDDAFDGCDNLTLRCYEGSAGHEYALENGLNYELI